MYGYSIGLTPPQVCLGVRPQVESASATDLQSSHAQDRMAFTILWSCVLRH
jgi:hypothetical protein